MIKEKKDSIKNSVGRMIFVGLSMIIQIAWIILMTIKLNEYSTVIAFISNALALIVVFRIYIKDMNSAFKMPWIIMILIFPVLGLCVYLILGRSNITKGKKKHFRAISSELNDKLGQDDNTFKKLEAQDIAVANQARYIRDYGKYPIYDNTDVEFYSTAEEGFEAQLEAIKKAKNFIFMEYHAIEESTSFLRMKEILVSKVREGVEVRIFYDDVGSVGFINKDFIKRMEAVGIKCRVFNPIIPFLNVFMNNRDHRKITVIDGQVGFTGGYNLADEYFNIVHPYGHWKDTGVKLTGEAVRSFTVMFLEMWNSIKKTDDDYSKYFEKIQYTAHEHCYVQPYASNPLERESFPENVYLNIIKNAKRRLYFATPYLIISDEMMRELQLAAKRGVDVRIITPGIPDKKFIYKVTRSYYAGLIKSGVRIYEYTPGFIHQKQCVCDSDISVVGTINLDYRSLYLNFENGVLLYNCQAIKKVADDFEQIISISEEVTSKYKHKKSTALRATQCVLRLFSPLL